MFLRSSFAAAFQHYWTQTLHQTWSHDAAVSFANSKIKRPAANVADLSEAEKARKAFLESDVGIEIDLFFGGGAFDFQTQSSAGFVVSSDAKGQHGVAGLAAKRPEWFTDAVIPQSLSGEPYYDAEKRWVGCCLASLGIVYNREVLKRLGIEKEPAQWEDLGDAHYIGQIALADPNKSGTVTKAFEQLIQQQIQQTFEASKNAETSSPEQAIHEGWNRGLKLIQRISANARYFTDTATKIPLEVAQGDAAAGMCIDFYGRTYEEQLRQPDGSTRVSFVAPVGGTSIGVDPIGLLRGAPEPEVATAFMEFVLQDEGQKLWNYKVGTAGGPVKTALRRLPVRRDFYTEAHRPFMSDATAQPYEDAKAFTYHPEWTGSLFNALRFLVKVMCIEVHDEQRRAWKMLVEKGFPKRAMDVFSDLSLINYEAAQELASELKNGDKELEVKKARELSTLFREQYNRAYELAKAGQ